MSGAQLRESRAVAEEGASWKRRSRLMCISLHSILDSRMAERQRLRKKLWLMMRKSRELLPAQCHLLFRYSRVMLFSFFHTRTSPTNSSHSSAVTSKFCRRLILFFQMYLNNNFPIFFVTFFVETFVCAGSFPLANASLQELSSVFESVSQSPWPAGRGSMQEERHCERGRLSATMSMSKRAVGCSTKYCWAWTKGSSSAKHSDLPRLRDNTLQSGSSRLQPSLSLSGVVCSSHFSSDPPKKAKLRSENEFSSANLSELIKCSERISDFQRALSWRVGVARRFSGKISTQGRDLGVASALNITIRFQSQIILYHRPHLSILYRNNPLKPNPAVLLVRKSQLFVAASRLIYIIRLIQITAQACPMGTLLSHQNYSQISREDFKQAERAKEFRSRIEDF